MDYCEDFRLIQIKLNHCNEFVKNFEKINNYGGCEIYVKEIALRLKNVFLSRGYNNQESHELRKINLLLMLNTEASFKYDLKEDIKICHLLNNFAPLTKCLYANLIWELKLEKYLYEALKFLPSWFILQFLDEIVDSLRFSKSFDVILQVKELVEAIYTNICRMDYKCTSSDQQVDQKIILSKFTDNFTSLLRNYNTPNTEESLTKSKRRLREFNGYALNYQLQLVLSCLKMFQEKPQFEIDEKFHIYKINADKEPETNNYSTNRYSESVSETLNTLNVILLNTLQNSILNITLEDFMYWVEIDIDDILIEDIDLKRDNLQKLIGEQAYELIELINANEKFEHNVVKQLSTISIKPKSIQDIAKEATVGTILEKIENSPSRGVWLDELLSRKDTLYFNTECLQTIIDNIEIVDMKHLLKMLNDHQNFSMDSEDEAQMKEIFLKAGSKLNTESITMWIEELIRTMGSDYNVLIDTEIVYENEMRNYMNKISETNIEEKTMWRLILKYPQKFYEMLLEQIEINQDETTILKVIEITMSISSNFIKKLIIDGPDISSKKSSYHNLLAGIFKLQIMERKEFVKDILMNNFSKALSCNDHKLLLVHLHTLKILSNHIKITDLLPPLMIQLAQILDKFRWDLMTYSSTREEIVDLAITNIQHLIKTVLINGSKNEKEWIKSKIDNLKVSTKFYFQKLSLEKGEEIVPFDEFLAYPDKLQDASKAKITTFLCDAIVKCTSKECKRLMNNEILQKFYTNALTCIAMIVKKSNQSVPIECLKKCVNDYVKNMTEMIIPKNPEELLLKDVINLIKQFPSSSYDDLTILFLEALKMFKKCENFVNIINELEDCDLKRILLE
ncbi:hypothetical protein PVAND_009192 [Polypedilum vanderplanki]|uniref:Uncharacterized protein n=1 Tax=Polypedilum vanderplanki TaxID=319348 RepID=A0A9J6CC50_POLVA|nr:hypothetical protein PVAND_009192 [Polypedilum vanderplanki]